MMKSRHDMRRSTYACGVISRVSRLFRDPNKRRFRCADFHEYFRADRH